MTCSWIFRAPGNRDRCQKVLNERDNRLGTLVLAECLENEGHFIPGISEIIEALCAERTWMLPAHDRKLRNFDGKLMDMDLRSTLVGWDLATAHYLLGEKLSEAIRSKLEQEVNRRILKPFREIVEGRAKGAYWLRATHNWNAVCLAGVAGSALPLVESAEDRAWYVAAVEHYIQSFLSGFTPDGYCSEGMGYWGYGYGRFLMLSEMLRQSTQGKVDLMTAPEAAAPALYALRAEIINGLYPSIADCSPRARPDVTLIKYIADRFDLDRPERRSVSFASRGHGLGPGMVFNAILEPLPMAPRPALAKPELERTWFNDGGVLICRPGSNATPFAAVLKAGHNGEHHNHNDIGSFSVVLGSHVLICDPGGEVYTARTFSPQRYESKLLNSYGHGVPVVDGKLQSTGMKAHAKVLRTKFSEAEDQLTLDLTSGYAVDDLKKLEREFVFRRGARPALTVRDTVSFEKPHTFETALITWGKWKETAPGKYRIEEEGQAVEVTLDTGGRAFIVVDEVLKEDVGGGRQPTRLGFKLKEPLQSGQVSFSIIPAL